MPSAAAASTPHTHPLATTRRTIDLFVDASAELWRPPGLLWRSAVRTKADAEVPYSRHDAVAARVPRSRDAGVRRLGRSRLASSPRVAARCAAPAAAQ